jgi:hypothetical protein
MRKFFTPLRILILFFALAVLFANCMRETSTNKNVLTEEIKAQVSDTLEHVVLAFLHSWEPPFYPDSALALFTQTDDFSLVIDGWYSGSYREWAEGVPNYMADDDYYFTSYRHEVKEIRTVPLSPESGVVTIVYVWDHVDREGVHERTDGMATIACRKEEGGWKIVQYHGSHHEMPPVE